MYSTTVQYSLSPICLCLAWKSADYLTSFQIWLLTGRWLFPFTQSTLSLSASTSFHLAWPQVASTRTAVLAAAGPVSALPNAHLHICITCRHAANATLFLCSLSRNGCTLLYNVYVHWPRSRSFTPQSQTVEWTLFLNRFTTFVSTPTTSSVHAYNWQHCHFSLLSIFLIFFSSIACSSSPIWMGP